jgi:hypothetical protein
MHTQGLCTADPVCVHVMQHCATHADVEKEIFLTEDLQLNKQGMGGVGVGAFVSSMVCTFGVVNAKLDSRVC